MQLPLRVALNPFEKASADGTYPYDTVSTLASEEARRRPYDQRQAYAWISGSRRLARELLPSAPFTTLDTDVLELLSGERRGNRGLSITVLAHTLIADSIHVRRRDSWTKQPKIWVFSGSMALNGTNYLADGATKGPNGGGFVRLQTARI
jgi:hypothetical protein